MLPRSVARSHGALQLVAVLVLLPLLAGVLSAFPTSSMTGSASSRPARPFAPNSPWNKVLPNRPTLDAHSAVWVSYLAGAGKAQSALLDETGVPIFEADARTPRHQVLCTRSDYGRCSTESIPIPDAARPARGADGALVVIDRSTRRHYDFWQLRREGGRWVASWWDAGSLDGDGRDSQTVGAGVSRLAGVVRASEIRAGRIDHAMVFASPINAPRQFRFPARKTDGANLGNVAVPLPAGARIQLDPALDVDRLPGITPAEKTMARALQRYGAYNIDNGGYRMMGFSFETMTGPGNAYRAAGLPDDYAALSHIPWDRLRVLRQWDGG